jgi:hypothetical protein
MSQFDPHFGHAASLKRKSGWCGVVPRLIKISTKEMVLPPNACLSKIQHESAGLLGILG